MTQIERFNLERSLSVADLKDFDPDGLPPNLYDVAELFQETMLACQFNIPDNRFLDEAMDKLLESRNLALEAVRRQGEEHRQKTAQSSLDLEPPTEKPSHIRFPSWPHIRHDPEIERLESFNDPSSS